MNIIIKLPDRINATDFKALTDISNFIKERFLLTENESKMIFLNFEDGEIK